MKTAGFVISLMLVLSLSTSLTASPTQTDWSGGGGVQGPVTDWGDTFDFETNNYWLGSSDDLSLDIVTLNTPVEHVVDSEFDHVTSIYAADVDGDGDMDVLGAAYDADDIIWWEVIGYSPEGSLQSSVLDVQESPDWQMIDWTCSEPSGTSVAFQVKASDNSASMGPWSDTLTIPCSLDGILTDGDSLFQYKTIFTTSDPDSTPVLSWLYST